MKFGEIKDKLLSDRLFKGVAIGALAVLAIEFVILSAVYLARSLPDPDGGRVPSGRIEAAAQRNTDSVHGLQDGVAAEDTVCGGGEVYEYNIPVSKYRKVEGSIRSGEFFSTLMTRLGASQNDIYALDAKSKGVFDMRQIRVGNHYHAYYLPGDPDTLAYVVYEKDNTSYVLFGMEDTLSVCVYEKDIVKETDYVEVNISNSLWQDVLDAGAPALLAVSLAGVHTREPDLQGLLVR